MVKVGIMAFEILDESLLGSQLSTSREAERFEPGVLRVPVELIIKIIELMDFRSVLSLIRVNKRFKEIYDGNRGHILLSILETELSPFGEALQIVTFKSEDIDVPLGPCLRRRIYHKNKLVCKGESLQPGEDDHVLLPPVVLDNEHFERLLRLFKTVKAWEQLFPRYRFQPASDCRELHPSEAKRLRAALYRWTSYAQFFHGDLPRPNNFVPQQGSTDIRCKRLRLLSDHELHELDDLWETVQCMVRGEICPSTEAVLKEMDYSISREEAERIGFGTSRLSLVRAAFSWSDSTFVDFDTNVNSAIVDTFLKLSPAEILSFATNKSTYTRDRLVREVCLAHPSILLDRQSLGHALSVVKDERDEDNDDEPAVSCLKAFKDVKNGDSGGILDFRFWDKEIRGDWSWEGQRALSWSVQEEPDLGIRVVMNRGRLEP
ncbi:hypothetical protein FJTKL_05165 [Diaporthe vaccinii]|uniref:F-box domain-containing protein n=1 Tax=Diaporthe vaccinii TaxID=105482 RepID=A0ABR4FER9_9PEZI